MPSWKLLSYNTAGLSLSGVQPALAEICAALRERALLLILDNAEHLLAQEADAAPLAELVGALVAAAPALKLLVTSRAPLAVRDEWLFAASSAASLDALMREIVT